MTIDSPLLIFFALLWGMGVSYLQERFGTFDKLDPQAKQMVNAITSYVVPVVLAAVTKVFGEWPDALGSPEGFTAAILTLVAPVAVWLVSQVSHQLDRLLQGTGDRVTGKIR